MSNHLWTRLRRALLRRAQDDRDIEDEIRFHLSEETRLRAERGEPIGEARRTARRAFGNATLTKENVREIWVSRMLEVLVEDLRHSARRLARRPAPAVTAILTLTLAIGATVVMFSLSDRVLLRPLDVSDPSRLVVVREIRERDGVELHFTGTTWELYQRLRDASMATLDGLAASSDPIETRPDRLRVSFGPDAPPEYARGSFVTANYFRVLGLDPAAGRDFEPADDTGPNSVPPVILSHRLWRTGFGSDTRAIDRTIEVNSLPVRIIGVAPPGFTGTDLSTGPPDLFLPLMTASRVLGTAGTQTDGNGRFFTPGYPGATFSPVSPVSRLRIVGRLKDGVVLEQAQAEFTLLADPDSGQALAPLGEVVLPFQSLSDVRRFLALLVGAVSLTLLVGCANIASLFLARAEERRAELAVRAALGAGRARLVRELAGEPAILALAGGATGFAFAQWIEAGLSAFALPGGISVASLRAGVDARTTAFAVCVTVATAIIIGLAPAWRGAGVDIVHDIQRRGGSPRLGLTLSLVGLQVTLSIIVVFGALLFMRSISEALTTDVGFDSDGLVSFTVHPPPAASVTHSFRILGALDALVERAREIPGVANVTIGPRPLFEDGYTSATEFRVDGTRVSVPALRVYYLDSDYFTTLGQRVVSGRDFNEGDNPGSPPVAIVSESAARRFWPGAEPLSRELALRPDQTAATVVGVVRDVKLRDLRDDGQLAVYLVGSQYGGLYDGYRAGRMDALGSVSLIIRITRDTTRASVLRRVGEAAAAAGLPPGEIITYEERIGALLMPQRLGRLLLTLLGSIALLLVGVGIYGLVSCVAARSEKEIGVRRAVGASSANIMKTLGMQTLWPVLAGVSGGSVVAWWGGRFADRFMYGISGSDSLTILAAVAVLVLVAAAAALTPLRRALRINPVDVLRAD